MRPLRPTPASTPSPQRTYFIANETTGAVKIGTSVDPDERLAQLQTGSDCPLRLLGSVSGGRDVERLLHSVLKEFHLRGEWFSAKCRPLVESFLAPP